MMIRNTRVMAAVTVILLWAPGARADKLQDFKDAVAAKPGCESIPYKDLFKVCDGKNEVMHEWCDGKKGPITCDAGTTRTLKKSLEKERQNYEKLKDKKQIDASERAMDAIKSDMDKRKDFVETAISTIETCIDHRRAIMNIFAEALDKVRGENDDDIKPLARTLRDRFEESKSGHEIAITSKQNARENCKLEAP